MSAKRIVEIFSAGCPICEETVELVKSITCPSCDVAVLDMHEPAVVAKAKSIGVRTLPAVVVEGRLAGCCANRGADEATLRAAGVGLPLP